MDTMATKKWRRLHRRTQGEQLLAGSLLALPVHQIGRWASSMISRSKAQQQCLYVHEIRKSSPFR